MFTEIRGLLLSALLTIGLTQIFWVGVYSCQVTRNLIVSDDPGSVHNDASDGTNISDSTAFLIFVSFLLVSFSAFFYFQSFAKLWLSASSLAISFGIAGKIFQDAVAVLPGVDDVSQLAITSTLTAAYGGGSTLAFFTKHLPAWCRQLYTVTNCAAYAAFLLSALPGSTAWMLLAAVAAWDLTTLLPFHPVRLAIERKHPEVFRFLMFTSAADDDGSSSESDDDAVFSRSSQRSSAGAEQQSSGDEGSQSHDPSSYSDSDASYSDYAGEMRSNGGGVSLGVGALIFYSILVGRSMAVGLLPALATTFGVLVGLAFTLIIKDAILPASTISYLFGLFGHVFTVSLVGAADNNYFGV